MAVVTQLSNTCITKIQTPTEELNHQRISNQISCCVLTRHLNLALLKKSKKCGFISSSTRPRISCSAAEGQVATPESSGTGEWVPVIPIEALPKGERRIIRQGPAIILLLWYRNEIYAIESTSPAEGAYSEGFINAKLTQDGCIVCPTTGSTYDLKTGQLRDWYPNNPVLRALTPSLRDMRVFPVKVEDFQICVSLTSGVAPSEAAEVVFGGKVNVGRTASDVAANETRMVVDESEGGFGFTLKNELINGRAAMIGFVMLLIIEVTTGEGLLATTGFLEFLYRTVITDGPIFK